MAWRRMGNFACGHAKRSSPLVTLFVDARGDDATKHLYSGTKVGRLAQLVRVLPSHGRGRGFESRSAHSFVPAQEL
jgi:hypothetical protein